ncbi:MAG: hypothetical protein KME29_33500 [Calothrix sp. FI2-JRJ7]|nr:hypothetical protein [Calothrix sp. FI2-JRJ7]
MKTEKSSYSAKKVYKMWQPVVLPFICERIIAFSIPENAKIWVLSWDELLSVTLAPEICVSIVKRGEEIYDVIDEERSVLMVNEEIYPMLGLYGGVPILRNNVGDGLSLEPQQERLVVLNCSYEIKQIIEFYDGSGDWRWATFSVDSCYLIIGVPHFLHVYKWVEEHE